MNANLRRSINQYFKNDDEINDMIQFIVLNRSIYPANVVKDKYLLRSKNFVEQQQDLLFYSDSENDLRLEYVKDRDKDERLNELYNNLQLSLGKGIKTFYYLVCSKTLNITRKECEEFLKSKPSYNVTRPAKKQVKYSLSTYSACRQAFAIDHLEMSRIRGDNKNTDYILVILDCFCKKVWLTATRKKDMAETAKIFNETIILNNFNPKIVLADNAFKGEFSQLLLNNNIKIRHNPSHIPVKMIEACNRNVRKFIKELQVRTNNLNYIDNLNLIEDAINNTKSSVTNKTPNELWSLDNNTDKKNEEYKKIVNKVNKTKNKPPADIEDKFIEGQPVRILLTTAYPEMRSRFKASDQTIHKHQPILWSPDVYYINKVYNAKNHSGIPLYSIRNDDNLTLRNRNNTLMKLRFSDLMDASKEDTLLQKNLTWLKALKLNKIRTPAPELQFRVVESL